MSRVDVRLVELGLAPSRAKAQAMIRAGEVEVAGPAGWRIARRVSENATEARVVAGGESLRFVSRGGLKLDHALDVLQLDLRDARVLDIGQSTGGFTDCVLKRGANSVLGIDVGHGQLHPTLRADPRVTVLEEVNARGLSTRSEVRSFVAKGIFLLVADLSFISLGLVLPEFAEILPRGTDVVLLVKPQFEAGARHLNARGIVTDERVFLEVRSAVERSLESAGFAVRSYFPCPLPGQDGNREFFAHAHRV